MRHKLIILFFIIHYSAFGQSTVQEIPPGVIWKWSYIEGQKLRSRPDQFDERFSQLTGLLSDYGSKERTITRYLRRLDRSIPTNSQFTFLLGEDKNNSGKWLLTVIGPGVSIEDAYSDFLIRHNVGVEEISGLEVDFRDKKTAFFLTYEKTENEFIVSAVRDFDVVNQKAQLLKQKKIKARAEYAYPEILNQIDKNQLLNQSDLYFKLSNDYANKIPNETHQRLQQISTDFRVAETQFNNALREYRRVLRYNAKINSLITVFDITSTIADVKMSLDNTTSEKAKKRSDLQRESEITNRSVRNNKTNVRNHYKQVERIERTIIIFLDRNNIPHSPRGYDWDRGPY